MAMEHPRTLFGKEAYVEVNTDTLHTVPPALANYPIFARTSAKALTALMTALWGKTTLHFFREPSPASACHAFCLPGLMIANIDFHAPLRMSWKQQNESYVCITPTLTSCTVYVGKHSFDLSPLTLMTANPGDTVRIDAPDYCPLSVIRIHAKALRAIVEHMRAAPWPGNLRLAPLSDLTSSAALRYSSALGLIYSEVMSPGSLFHQGLGREQLAEFMLSALLWMQPESIRARLMNHARKLPAHMAHIVASIEEDPARAWTLDELARMGKVSVRRVQMLFRDYVGCTPKEFVREARLLAARKELENAQVGETNVSNIADELGWSSLSYFSSCYYRRFNEYPHETLRKTPAELGE